MHFEYKKLNCLSHRQETQPTVPMKNRLRISLPLLSIAAAFFVFAAPNLRAQIVVGTNGPNETISTNFTGNQSLTKIGSNVVTLTGNNTYTGGTFLTSGTLIFVNSNNLGTVLVTMNTGNTGSNDTSLLADSTFFGNRQISISNDILVTASSGTTTIGSSALSAFLYPVAFSGAIELLSNNVTLYSAAANLAVPGAGDRTDFRGGISGTGDVTISTDGANSRVVFTDKANTFTGNVFISPSSTLQLSDSAANSNSLIPDAAIVDVGTNAFFKLAKGGNSETIGGLTGSGTIQAIAGADTLVLDVAEANSLVFDGALTGSLALTKAGLGTQTLLGGNTYTGGTAILAGGLTIGGSGVLGGGDYTANITNIGSFSYDSSANQTLHGTFSGGGEINKGGTGSLTLAGIPNFGGSTLNITHGTAAFTGNRFGADIGLAAINIVGSHAVLQTTVHALGGYNKPVPDIAITNGTWNLQAEQYINSLVLDQAMVNGPGEVRSDSAFSVLVTNGTSTWSAPLNLVVRDGAFNVVSGATLQMSGRVVGSPGLVKNGEGTMVLNAASSTYSGYTTISNGVLQAGTNGTMSSNSLIRVRGGSFDLNGTTNVVGGLILHNATNSQSGGSLTTRFTTGLSDDTLQIGADATDVAKFTLDGGSVLVQGALQVGYRGNGTFDQTGGTNAVSDQYVFVLGRFFGATGTYNLSGGTARQASTAFTIIGEEGEGRFNVSGNGVSVRFCELCAMTFASKVVS
jgi:autotransporter-associated beta strand protein